MIWRPLYVPQAGQATCGGFCCRQARLLQAARVGAEVFHWARRDRVFDREVLRLGTATLLVLLLDDAVPLHERGPARINRLMPVVRAELRPL